MINIDVVIMSLYDLVAINGIEKLGFVKKSRYKIFVILV